MLLQRINRTDPEKVFIVVKAQEACKADRPAVLHFTGTDDGLLAAGCDAATDPFACIGIYDAAITSGSFGLVQCYGYRSQAKMTLGSNAAANCHGSLNVEDNTDDGLLDLAVSLGADTAVQPNFILAQSASTASNTDEHENPIFIRCM